MSEPSMTVVRKEEEMNTKMGETIIQWNCRGIMANREELELCLFVCGISLASGQLISELFPDCTRSCFSQVVSRRRGVDRIYEMRCLFVAVGLNTSVIVMLHWDNMS